MSRFIYFIVFSIVIITFYNSAHAKKIALVIGNDDYSSVEKLKKAVNDSRAVADALTSLGFDVTHIMNVNNQKMNLAIYGSFIPKIAKGDEVIFYYAGHGVEIRNRNYLLATDIPKVKPNNERVITKSGFAVDEIMQAIEENGSQVALLILDACRNNPFPKTGQRSLGSSRGLGRTDPPKGTFVMYSAGARQTALDALEENDPNPNSVYTRKLVPLLKTPGISLSAMAKRLRGEVETLAKTVAHDQFPAYYDQLRGSYYLAGRQIRVEGSNSAITALPSCSAQDKALWARVQQEKTKSAYEFYKSRFPKGCNVAVAEFELATLQKLKKPETNKPVKPVVGAYPNTFTHGYKFQDCRDCPKMIVVRGDTFTMGSSKSEKESQDDERPQHEVTIKKFAVGQYEVTRGQFHKFVQETGYDIGSTCWTHENSKWEERSNRNYLNPGFSQESNHPVTCVNWNDAKAYVKWLSRKTGKPYRLPTEAEWEYVASTKRSTAFWLGNSISTDQANYNGNSTYNSSKGVYRKKTVAVDRFDPNPFGLYNVHGNVWEWVEDCYHDSYKNAPKDGSAWLEVNGGNCNFGVLRGGSWFNYPRLLRARDRYRSNLDLRSYVVGFRVVRTSH